MGVWLFRQHAGGHRKLPTQHLSAPYVMHGAPLQAVLQSYLAGVQRSPVTEDAIYRAQQLLAALAQLGDI